MTIVSRHHCPACGLPTWSEQYPGEAYCQCDDGLRDKAIRQSGLEDAGFRMRPDGTYFKGGN